MLRRDLRDYQRKPGLSRAAKLLGISYGHARRVWLGEREAPHTLEKLQELISDIRRADKSTKTA